MLIESKASSMITEKMRTFECDSLERVGFVRSSASCCFFREKNNITSRKVDILSIAANEERTIRDRVYVDTPLSRSTTTPQSFNDRMLFVVEFN